MRGVLVRERRAEDVAALVAALADVHAADGYPVEARHVTARWLLAGDTLAAWTAEADGAVTGHAALLRPPAAQADARWIAAHPEDAGRLAVLARLFVHPGGRGRAVGAALVRAAQEHAREQGLRPVLDVMAKDLAAIALYEHLGWREFDRCAFLLNGGWQPARCLIAP